VDSTASGWYKLSSTETLPGGFSPESSEQPLRALAFGLSRRPLYSDIPLAVIQRPGGGLLFTSRPGLFLDSAQDRLLGLSHVIFWTPLVVYLLGRLRDLEPHGWFALWVRALLVTNALSLVIDYVDVVRYVVGDRS